MDKLSIHKVNVILQAGFGYRINLSYLTTSFKKEIEEGGQEGKASTSKFRVVCFMSLMEMEVNACINGNMLFPYCKCSELITEDKAVSWNK